MDKILSNLFNNWQDYIQKTGKFFGSLNTLLADLGIAADDVTIISFVSSALHGEIKYYDSAGESSGSKKYLTSEKKAENDLSVLF